MPPGRLSEVLNTGPIGFFRDEVANVLGIDRDPRNSRLAHGVVVHSPGIDLFKVSSEGLSVGEPLAVSRRLEEERAQLEIDSAGRETLLGKAIGRLLLVTETVRSKISELVD